MFSKVKMLWFLEGKIHRGMEQLVARWAHNPKVTGSSPVPATKNAGSVVQHFRHSAFSNLTYFL